MTTPALSYPLSIAPNVPVFDLPIHVALEHGLFKKNGLDVRFAERHDAEGYPNQDAFQRQKESLYEDGKAEAYNLCEWAGLIAPNAARATVSCMRCALPSWRK